MNDEDAYETQVSQHIKNFVTPDMMDMYKVHDAEWQCLIYEKHLRKKLQEERWNHPEMSPAWRFLCPFRASILSSGAGH